MRKQRRLRLILVFFFIAVTLQIDNYMLASSVGENKNYRFCVNDLNSQELVNLYDIENTYIPKSFSLRKQMYIPVTDQQNLGLCETFATLKCIETNYALKTGTYIDLSERYLDYMMSTDFYSTWRVTGMLAAGSNYGSEGDATTSAEVLALAESFGAPTEEDVPYRNYSENEYSILLNAKPALMVRSTVLFPNIQNVNAYNLKQGWINVLKVHLMKYGALDGIISTPMTSTNNYNQITNSYYSILPKGENEVGHAINIVGWDDNYPKENFKIKPDKDGAFICLNSWGSGWGDNGYFYISYSDVNILTQLIGVIDTKVPDEYRTHTYASRLFSYKGFISKNANSFGLKFKKDKKNEYISHITAGIGVYKEDDYNTRIKYYINPYDDTFDTNKMIYLGETSAITNGLNSNITLDEPIKIEGDNFSIMFVLEGNLSNIFCSYSKDGNGALVSGNMFAVTDDSKEWESIDVEFPVYLYTLSKNTEILKGDINQDYFINSTDAAIVLDKFKSGEITEDDYELGDMDGNGILNSTDAAMILDIFKNG